MIINKNYIDENYEFIISGYVDMARSSINYMASTGRSNDNIKVDLISLNHYIKVITEFAKYYGYLIDQVSSALEDYPDYNDYSIGDEAGIVDKYIKTTDALIKDIAIRANADDAKFLLGNIVDLNSTIVLQDQIIADTFALIYSRLNSFMLAIRQSNEIVYKYSRIRYTARPPGLGISVIIDDLSQYIIDDNNNYIE